MRISCIGKPSRTYGDLVQYYTVKIRYYDTIQLLHSKDMSQYTNIEERILKETIQLLKNVRSNERCVVLTLDGKQYTSEEFARKLSIWNTKSTPAHFCIAGTYGFCTKALPDTCEKLTLSTMTFPHEMALIVLLEQLYRAYTLINNVPYHH